MIVDAFINMVVSWLGSMIDSMPQANLPDWMNGPLDFVNTVFGFANSMSVWFPTPLVMTIIGALFTVYAISFGIKVVRILISHVTGGGGGAA